LRESDSKYLQDLLTNIRGRDVGKRMAALERLEHNRRTHAKAAMELVNDRGRDIRVLGCQLLAAINPSCAVKLLIEKTVDRDPNVREAACSALGRFRGPRVVAALSTALRDRTWIAYAAACSLGEIGGRRALDELLRLFRVGDSLKATAACEAILRWNDPPLIHEMIEMIRKWRGKKRSRFLRILLEQGDLEVLRRLRYVFGDILLDHLDALFQDQHNSPMRLHMFAAEFANGKACDLILKELVKRDPDDDDYSEMLSLFSSLNALWKDRADTYFAQPDRGFILPLVKACVATDTRIKEPVLRRAFDQSSLDGKREIARNLPLLTEPSPEFIEILLCDSDDHIKGYGAEAAAFFHMAGLSARIEEFARSGFSDIRQKALRSLCILDHHKAKALAEHFVTLGTGDDKKVYLGAMELLDEETNYHLIRTLIHSREIKIVALAVIGMGSLVEHDPRYLDLLGLLLRRRRVLPEALEIIKSKRLKVFKPEILHLLTEVHDSPWIRYQALSALAAMEDDGLFDLFAEGLKDEHNLIKIAGMRGLASLGRERAWDLISPFLENADPALRHAARTALDTLGGNDGRTHS
jgi:HEAT repeat protein